MAIDMQVHRVDVDYYQKQGLKPTLVLPTKGPAWSVLIKPVTDIATDTETDFVSVCTGDYAICPLIPYLVKANPMTAMCFVAQLGLVVGTKFPNAKNVVIALGNPLESVTSHEYGELYRLWLGFALN